MTTTQDHSSFKLSPFLVSIKVAADAIGVGRTRMYELLSGGQISAVKCGRQVLIPVSQLERYSASLPAAKFRPL